VFAEVNQALVRDLVGFMVATIMLLVAAWFSAELLMLRKIRTIRAATTRVVMGGAAANTAPRVS